MDGFRTGTLLRIFVDECDRHGAQPLYTAIVEYLRSRNVAGATVFKGIEGFGSHYLLHVAKLFSWAPNLPVLIEVVEDEAKVEEILPDLESMVGEGLLSLERVEYLRLRKADRKAREGHAR